MTMRCDAPDLDAIPFALRPARPVLLLSQELEEMHREARAIGVLLRSDPEAARERLKALESELWRAHNSASSLEFRAGR